MGKDARGPQMLATPASNQLTMEWCQGPALLCSPPLITTDYVMSLAKPAIRRRLIIGTTILAAVGLSALAYTTFREPAAAPITDPRLTYPSPFLNVKPDVQYVGDQACASCHAALVESYQKHSMGRSLAILPSASPVERYSSEARNPFLIGDLRYSVENRGERTLHREERLKGQRSLTELANEVHYAIGSGTRARSYLISTDGYLFQSPITWFSQANNWNLSPGFQTKNLHFGRTIDSRCLFCHANRVEPVPHSTNRYVQPIFRGESIGCERCHGPGSLHIENRVWRTGMDVSIVNPKHLPPDLREAVCEQCHLESEQRVLRRGRQDFDYRPGLPLYEFMAIYVKPTGPGNQTQFVGHVEQFHDSLCYQKSKGKMGCSSCHDPHRLPAAEERVAFYRERCLQCHESQPCAQPQNERRRVSPDDSCIQCHMPKVPTEIQHTAVSNHAIRRHPESLKTPAGAEPAKKEFVPFVLYHKERLAAGDEELGRDYAVALAELAEAQGLHGLQAPTQARQTLSVLLLPLVEPAARRDPRDWPLREAQATSLWMANRPAEAAATYEEILRRVPNRETSLVGAAWLALERQRPAEAEALWRRAIAVNPYRWLYYQRLAMALVAQEHWREAMEPLRESLRLHPLDLESRKLLVACLLESQDSTRARAEFRLLIDLDPPDRAALEEWFAKRTKDLPQ